MLILEEKLLTAFTHISPFLEEWMDLADGQRRFGNPDLLCTLKNIEDVQNATIVNLFERYQQWLGQVYLPGSSYPGDSTENTTVVISETVDPCPTYTEAIAASFPASLAAAYTGCGDPNTATPILLDDFISSVYWDRTRLEIQTAPTLGTLVADVNARRLLYTLNAGVETGTDTMTIIVYDTFGTPYYIPLTVQIDCTAAVDCGAFNAIITYISIGSQLDFNPALDWTSVLSVSVLAGGTAPYTYLWTVDADLTIDGPDDQELVAIKFDPSVFGTSNRKAYLTITDANGCVLNLETWVTYDPTYHCDCDGNELSITVQDGSFHDFDWAEPDVYHLGIVLDTNPSNGTVLVTDALNGQFRYTPNPGYTGPDSFRMKWDGGLIDGGISQSYFGFCDVTVNVIAADPPCPVPTFDTLVQLFSASSDPAGHIAGTDLILIELETSFVVALGDFTVTLYVASDGTLVEVANLVGDNWQFDGTTLYGGFDAVATPQLYRIRVEATNGCGTTTQDFYIDHQVNQAPVAEDEEAWVGHDQTVIINLTGKDSDPDGHDLIVTEIDGNPFDDGANDTVVLAGKGTVEWLDGENIQFTPEPGVLGAGSFLAINFDYTLQDIPPAPFNALTDTGNVVVNIQLKCTGVVQLAATVASGAWPTRVIDVTSSYTDIDPLRTVEWFLNLGAGYGAAHASVSETPSFDEAVEGTIYSIRIVVTDPTNNCVYSAEIFTGNEDI